MFPLHLSSYFLPVPSFFLAIESWKIKVYETKTLQFESYIVYKSKSGIWLLLERRDFCRNCSFFVLYDGRIISRAYKLLMVKLCSKNFGFAYFATLTKIWFHWCFRFFLYIEKPRMQKAQTFVFSFSLPYTPIGLKYFNFSENFLL